MNRPLSEYAPAVQASIIRTIRYIQSNLSETLTLERLAAVACYSPYHFLRLFRQHTGLTPQYYISSARLQYSKQLLLSSDLPVRDICLEIGQHSLGTFTTRFVQRVGVTPAQFRRMAESAEPRLLTLQESRYSGIVEYSRRTVCGVIDGPADFRGVVFVGLFPRPIPEGMPVCGRVLHETGLFALPDVPDGTFYAMCTAIDRDAGAQEFVMPQSTLRATGPEPVIVREGRVVTGAIRLSLRERRETDPPILVSLPMLAGLHLLLPTVVRK